MNKLKLINILSNIMILINLLVGFMQIHWLVIPIFFAIHAGLRLAYVKAESQSQAIDPTKAQTTIAPPVVRNIASVITSVILALALYWIGFGVRYLSVNFM